MAEAETQPIEELDDAELVKEYRQLQNDVDWFGTYEEQQEEWDRAIALWREIRSRSDVEAPECPGCGGQQWGQTPGDPKYCTECGREVVDHELADEINEAWDGMLEGEA